MPVYYRGYKITKNFTGDYKTSLKSYPVLAKKRFFYTFWTLDYKEIKKVIRYDIFRANPKMIVNKCLKPIIYLDSCKFKKKGGKI